MGVTPPGTAAALLLLLSLSFLPSPMTSFTPRYNSRSLPISASLSTRKVTSSSSQVQEPDASYYSSAPDPRSVIASTTTTSFQRITLTRFLNNMVKEQPELRDLESLLLSIQMACKTISNLVNRAGLVCWPNNNSSSNNNTKDNLEDGRYYSMKRLDQLSTEVLKNALQFTGKVNVVAPVVRNVTHETPAQHQPGVLIATAYDSNYVACLDPLDGSGNADASICTGTVFGVFDSTLGGDGDRVLPQPGKNMRAAGYCLYSSATVLVFSLGDGRVQGFTLDPSLKEFVLTHANLTIPPRGTVYSCNEANSEGWSDEFQSYLLSLKRNGYAHRYVGSMVGDIHRTLLYGGIFCYPSDTLLHPHGNLQLLYKSAPMAFVVNQAGGKSMDQDGGDLLDVAPQRIHQKSPCFIGSPEDVDELRRYLLQRSTTATVPLQQ